MGVPGSTRFMTSPMNPSARRYTRSIESPNFAASVGSYIGCFGSMQPPHHVLHAIGRLDDADEHIPVAATRGGSGSPARDRRRPGTGRP